MAPVLPAPAALLGAVEADRVALHVAEVRDGDHHLLLGDEVLGGEVGGLGLDLGAPLVAEELLHLHQLADDHLEEHLLAAQDLLEPGHQLLHLGQLVEDLLPLQAGEALQLHLQDGLGLELGEAEARHQALAGHLAIAGLLDELDDLVDVIERDLQPEQDVLAGPGLLQVEAGPARHHVAAVGHEPLQHGLEVEDAGLAAVDREQGGAEADLQVGVGVEVVEHHLRHGVALQLDDDPHALAARLVAQVADPLDPLLAHQLGDLLHQPGLVDLVGDLGDDDRLALGLGVGLDGGAGADADGAAPVLVDLLDAVAAQDDAGGGEVRAGDEAHQLGHGGLGVVDQVDRRVDHLAHVVRRDVGGHAHGDAGRAVDQQVGEAGRQHQRLDGGVVEVGAPLDGLLVDVGQQPVGELVEARLGVAVGGRRVAVDRAEVALPVDERVAEVPLLRQAHQRVVDRRVAVRVVLLQHLADHAGALRVALVVVQPLGVHRVEDAAVHRLQAVAHVGERAADDHRHRVVEIRLAHLVFDVDLRPVRLGRGRRGSGRRGRWQGLVGHRDRALWRDRRARPRRSRGEPRFYPRNPIISMRLAGSWGPAPALAAAAGATSRRC